MNTQEMIILSGGEIRVTPRMERIRPSYQSIGYTPTPGEKTADRHIAAIQNLVAQVKADLNAKNAAPRALVNTDPWRRFVSKAQATQAETLASAVIGLVKGISKVWRKIGLEFGKLLPGK